jgi:hypothetical protein
VPFFRGYVKSSKPSDSRIAISASDCLSFLTGDSSHMVTANDNNNLDGMTLAQFLYDHIYNKVNINGNTFIGLDMLTDTVPAKSLSGFRKKDSGSLTALEVIASNPVKDDSIIWDTTKSDTTVLDWYLDVEDDGTKSNIVFKKMKSKSNDEVKSAVPFSFNNGLISYSIKETPIINTVLMNSEESMTSLETNDFKNGTVAAKYDREFDYPDAARQEAFLIISKSASESKEVTMKVSKGHYLPVGSLIQIKEVNEPSLKGYHNIIGKKMKVSQKDIQLTFTLGKPKPTLSDYIQLNDSLFN